MGVIVVVDQLETPVENQMKRNFATMVCSLFNSGMPPKDTKDSFVLCRKRGLPKEECAIRVNFAVSHIAMECVLTMSVRERTTGK